MKRVTFKILRENLISSTIFLVVFILLSFFPNLKYAPLVVFILYIMWIYYNKAQFLIKYFMIVFFSTTNILGVFIIETSNIFLEELSVYSKDAGSLNLIIIYHFLFLQTLWILDLFSTTNQKEIKTKNQKFKLNMVVNISFFIILIMLIRVIDKPFFLLTLDRFQYMNTVLNGIWGTLSSAFLYITPFLFISIQNNKNKIAITTLIFLVVFLLWTGNKFGYFLNIIFLFVLSAMIRFDVDTINNIKQKIKKYGYIIIISVALLVSIVFIHNYLMYGFSVSKNFTYLKQRLAQQGQMWWGTYLTEKSQGMRISEFANEIKPWFRLENKVDGSYGIYKMMYYIAPRNLVDNKLLNGSRYAYATPGSVFYYFKTPGLILFAIISAIGYHYLVSYYCDKINNKKVIISILVARLLIVYHRCLTQFDLYELFSIETLVTVVAIILLEFSERSNNHKRGFNNKMT